MKTRRPLMIGITGPIGCGKSTVAAMLRELGGTIVDADVLARHATDPGRPTLPAIRARFGDGVFDDAGRLDRAAMAAVAFEDPAALADLERIIHPEVRKMVESELERATSDEAPFLALEAIKLIEGGLADKCDEVWLVDCAPGTQRARLAARGADRSDIERRLAAQGPGLADRLEKQLDARPMPHPRVRRLTTDGSLEETRGRVEDALAEAFAT